MSVQCLATLALALALVSLSPCRSQEAPLLPYAKMIGDIEHRFHARCTFFLFEQDVVNNGLGIQEKYLKLWKELPAYDVISTFLPHHSFQKQRWNLSCSTRPLYLISLDSDRTRNLLRGVSQDKHLGFTVLDPNPLSTAVYWRDPTWLVFVRSDLPVEHYLSEVTIPIDSQVLVARPAIRAPDSYNFLLYETYNMDCNRMSLILAWRIFGQWNRVHGLLSNKYPFFERRTKLLDVAVTAQSLHNDPYTIVTDQKTAAGFVGQVWNLLEQKMNFRTNILLSARNMYDVPSALEQRPYPTVTLCDMPINYRFAPWLKYPVPLYSSTFQVYIRRPGSMQHGWWAFLTPLSPALWLVVAATLLLMAGALWGSEGGGPVGAVLTACGAFCSQGADSAPVSAPGRLSLLAGFLSVVVVAASYSAVLMASLTVHRRELSFRGLKELLTHGGYSVGVVRGSAEEMLLQSSTDTDLTQAYKLMLNGSSQLRPRSRREALERVCASQFALLLQKDQADALRNSIPCRIEALPDFSLPLSAGIPFTKNHPYLGIINYNLLKLRRSGVLGKLLDGARPPLEPAGPESSPGVGLEHVQSMLGVLALGAAAAVLVVVCEVAAHRVARRAGGRPAA